MCLVYKAGATQLFLFPRSCYYIIKQLICHLNPFLCMPALHCIVWLQLQEATEAQLSTRGTPCAGNGLCDLIGTAGLIVRGWGTLYTVVPGSMRI